MTRVEIWTAILIERARQETKWGKAHGWGEGDCSSPSLGDTVRATVLTEEVGEVARAVLDKRADDLRKELVQVAAVAVAWLEAL